MSASETQASGPLSGVRVLAFTQIVAGPFAGVVLSDFGAEVVKVEPTTGEYYRNVAAVVPDHGKRWQSLNRGQKSLSVDLQNPKGAELIRRIIKGFDAVVINFRPGVAERLGIGYEALSEINPKLIYCSITGFGPVGPWANEAATDYVATAFSGLVAGDGKTDDDGVPVGMVPSVADYLTGLASAGAISAALFSRDKTGLGQKIDASLLNSSLSIQDSFVMREPASDSVYRDPMMARVKEAFAGGMPYKEVLADRVKYRQQSAGLPRLYYCAYQTADGAIMLGCLTPKTRNAARLGLDMQHERTDDASFDPEDPKYHEQVDEWKKEITERVREHGTEHWLRRLREVGCPVAPVQFPEELSEHEQVKALGAMVSLEHPVTGPQEVVGPIVNFSKTKASVQGPSPLIGQHTEQLLLHGGLTRQEIDDLLEENIVR
jgi:crotonobetainyl-CoA:carnitine CoA-transferase CaiB-like acyl-CoA transferase